MNEASPVRYLVLFFITIAVILIPVVIGNYLIDPLLIHQWDTPLLQRLQPHQEKLIPWGKTYAIYKYQPQVLFIGNSRTEVGLPADSKMFGNKRVLNGAILGGRIWHDIAMLQHARNVSKLETVVWGVDYWSFTPNEGNPDFDKDLISEGDYYNVRRTLLDLKRSLSFDITWESIKLVLGQTKGVCRSSLVFYGQRDEACDNANLVDRGGVTKALLLDIRAVKDINKNRKKPILAYRLELEQLCKAGIRVMLYINPSHATSLEYFFQQDNGNDLELWKRDLVNVTNGVREEGCNVQLFDFSGFNSVTTENIPQVSGKPAMQNFWEASHYRTVVGRQILARMIPLVEEKVPADFGVELDKSNIDAHLLRIHSERMRYRAEHPQELFLMDKWFGVEK